MTGFVPARGKLEFPEPQCLCLLHLSLCNRGLSLARGLALSFSTTQKGATHCPFLTNGAAP